MPTYFEGLKEIRNNATVNTDNGRLESPLFQTGGKTVTSLLNSGKPISKSPEEEVLLSRRPVGTLQRIDSWVQDKIEDAFNFVGGFFRQANENKYTFREDYYEQTGDKLVDSGGQIDGVILDAFKNYRADNFGIGRPFDGTDGRGSQTFAQLVDGGYSVSKDEKPINFPSPFSTQVSNRYTRLFDNHYRKRYYADIAGGGDNFNYYLNVAGYGGIDEQAIKNAASYKHNLGQINGYDGWGNKASVPEGDDSLNQGLTESVYDSDDSFNSIQRQIRQGVSNLYDPFLIRRPNPEPEQFSLIEFMQQNLLLPDYVTKGTMTPEKVFELTYQRNSGDRGTANSNGSYTINKTGSTLDLQNLNDPLTFTEGAMGGSPVRRLREPALGINDRDSVGENSNTNFIHDFDDDAHYLIGQKQDAGFTSNINSVSPEFSNFLDSSVKTIDKDGTENFNVERAIRQQYFPFLFETINKGGNKIETCFLQATLSQFSENFTPQWNPSSFVGRTDKVWSYMETDRTIDIRFVVFANEGRQLQNVIERVNWLAQQTYPDYQDDRMSNGPLVRITVGDLIHRLPGFFRNMSINWDHSGAGGKWELTRNIRMPVSCEITTTFQVIHEVNPNRNTNFYTGLFSNDGIDKKKLIPNFQNSNTNYVSDLVDDARSQAESSSLYRASISNQDLTIGNEALTEIDQTVFLSTFKRDDGSVDFQAFINWASTQQ